MSIYYHYPNFNTFNVVIILKKYHELAWLSWLVVRPFGNEFFSKILVSIYLLLAKVEEILQMVLTFNMLISKFVSDFVEVIVS
jgi:hypothetical protein